jgi:hypothetical protein
MDTLPPQVLNFSRFEDILLAYSLSAVSNQQSAGQCVLSFLLIADSLLLIAKLTVSL